MRLSVRLKIFAAVAFTLALALRQGLAQEQQPTWLATATVSSDHVYLADLLAPDTDPQLHDLASQIDLGRAPEPGSFRVFTGSQLREAAGNLSSGLPPQITVRRQGYPVETQQLTAALAAAKLPLVPITLLSEPQTRTAHAVLRITGTFPGPRPALALVRFVCRGPSECGPFWGEIEASKSWQAAPSARKLVAQIPQRLTALVVPGRLATLICDEPGMEMRLRVRPLGHAGMGESVRVYDPGARRIFLARVQAEDLVTSGLREER